MPRRIIFVPLLLLALVFSLLLAMLVTSAAGSAPSGMACTAAQKARNGQVLASFVKAMPVQRAAFFRTHRKQGERAAFLKRQRARLAALRKAAACAVPAAAPLSPASSGPPCSPSLARSPRTDPVGSPSTYTEGATDYSIFLRPLGQIRGVMLFVDFSDAPGTESTNTLFDQIVPFWVKWYADVSNGRVLMNITPVPKWFRMPKASSEYAPDPFHYDPSYMNDAIAAADAEVDFSRYQIVYVIPTGMARIERRQSPYSVPGGGIKSQDGEILHATYVGRDTRVSWVFIHETLHHLGLPDLYDFQGDALRHAGAWDIMADGRYEQEVLAWHKWKLGWLDPDAIRCLEGRGQLEETISPSETTGKVRMVVVPTGPSTAYVVEVRRPIGHDGRLCQGVLVYTVDARVASGSGPIEIKPPKPGLSSCFAALNLDSPGNSSTYEDDTVKIELLASDGSAYRIRVTRK